MSTNSACGLCLGLVTAIAITACGGSSSDPPPVNPQPPPASITIAGTAAKGTVLGGAAVTAVCAAGSGTATSANDGKYSMTITGGALPCALKVVGIDGSTFHTVVPGTGTSGTFPANLSPLTEMVTSHVAGASPAAFFSGFGSTSTVPAASVAQARSYVEAAMAGLTNLVGVDALKDPLVAGNALDQKIDAVVAGLAAAGLTLPQVIAAIIENPAAPSIVATPLSRAATDCAWLKSGKYRLVNALAKDLDGAAIDASFRFQTIQVDAAALTSIDQLNIVTPMTSDGACQFSINDATVTIKVLVASSGMFIAHARATMVPSQRIFFLGVPEQTLPISELAGTWNFATWEPANIGATGSVVAGTVEVAVDATGQITAIKKCQGLAACTSATPPFGKFVANVDGGFDVVEAGSAVGRIFLFKTITGQKVAVQLDDDNAFALAVPAKSLGALPAVGLVSNFRFFNFNADNTISALGEDSTAVIAADDVARTVTRLKASDNRIDTLTYDKPRDGFRYRAPNSCTRNGLPFGCSEILHMPLQGIGLSVAVIPSVQPVPAYYEISLLKP